MRAIDLFSGAGGASMGLHRAGFEVVGVDNHPQPRYPFEFRLGDALEADLSGFDFVWASPPCQAHSVMKSMPKAKHHEDLIPATRAKLKAWGGPWIIENVPGAPLNNPVMLCGTMFGLGTKNAELRRHRLFECSGFPLVLVPNCAHGSYGYKVPTVGKDGSERYWPATIEVYGNGGGFSRRDARQMFPHRDRAAAMGIDWMVGDELSQSIPPAYSEFLARQVIKTIDAGLCRV